MSVDGRLDAGEGREFNRMRMLEGASVGASSNWYCFDRNLMAGRELENHLTGVQLEDECKRGSTIRTPKVVKVTNSEGHKNYELMINLQPGIRDIHIRFKTSDYPFHSGSYGASYVESLASPAAYGREKNGIVKGSHALHLFRCTGWSCLGYESYDDRVSVTYTEEDNSVEELDDCGLKGFWKKGKSKEKFVRKAKSRRYSSSGKEKKQKAQQRIRSKSKITFVRKNQRKHNQGKNLEVEDLHKQVLDFSVN
ncbi:hypothetical protein RHMOL_Rhmol12G0010900 [Rhododendron molle]|uniref:Uncharacterized protein n=1 Tax=Rhododendron molle TaxID=49168 RepID=A0ACC0LD62_RHOML|nr:hypothetical protein RHMOL_Rhmol12G0010900 [Rhododendron molle]